MLFNSYEFMFLFLPVTLVVYFGLARRRWTRGAVGWLAAASFFFYGWWDVRYVPLLLGSIVFNFLMGRGIGVKSTNASRRLASKKDVYFFRKNGK